MKSFLDVIELWPSAADLADDMGIKLSRVQKWQVRKKIPASAWSGLVAAAKKRGYSVSAETLLRASTCAPSAAEERMSA